MRLGAEHLLHGRPHSGRGPVLERLRDRFRHALHFRSICLRGGEHHHEESKHQGDEIRVGYQPAIMVRVPAPDFAAAHHDASLWGSATGAAPVLTGLAALDEAGGASRVYASSLVRISLG